MRVLVAIVLSAALAAGAAGAMATIGRGPVVPAALASVVERVEILPDRDNGLRGRLAVLSREPVQLVVTLTSDDHQLVITENAVASGARDIPLLALRAERTYAVELATTAGAAAAVGSLTTRPLPLDLPPVVVTSDPTRMAPGLTLFNQVYRSAPGEDGFADVGFLTAVDETGAIVWYHREPLNIQDARRLDDGDLLVVSDETGARRLTPTGETVAEWRGTSPGSDAGGIGAGLPPGAVVEVAVDSMHHDVQFTADGNLLTLSREAQVLTYDEPLCEGEEFDGTEFIVGDDVAVVDPVTGEVLEEHSLFDVLEPLDDPDPSEGDYCVSYLDRHYPGEEPRDWTHANAVSLSPDGTTYLVSNRHTDELVALRAVDDPGGPAGSLRWRFGPQGDLELLSGLWSWHQHAPEWLDDDTIIVYDNGNGRQDADDPYSRAVIYDIDEEMMTATQVWEHVPENRPYASFLGDADVVDGPSGDNVLITHGGQTDPCAAPNDAEQAVWGQIIEVERATGATVFDLTTQDLGGCVGWAIYRAERVPQLHPSGYSVEVLRR